MRNSEVAKCWRNGKPGKSGTGSFHTDGKDLYSYRLRIGYTEDDGSKVLFNYTGKDGPSLTTTAHIREAHWIRDCEPAQCKMVPPPAPARKIYEPRGGGW